MMQSSTLRDNEQDLLFESRWKEIYKICLKMALSWHSHLRYLTPDDLAQIAAIKVWMAFDVIRKSPTIDAFVKKVAFNAFIDAGKSEEGIYEISYDEMRPANRPQRDTDIYSVDPDDDEGDYDDPKYFIGSESRYLPLKLESLLKYLTDRQRQVIEKSYALGSTCWEQTDDSIAKDLHVTRQTVIADRKKGIREMQARARTRTKGAMAA